jgi:hypothetical protein
MATPKIFMKNFLQKFILILLGISFLLSSQAAFTADLREDFVKISISDNQPNEEETDLEFEDLTFDHYPKNSQIFSPPTKTIDLSNSPSIPQFSATVPTSPPNA